MCLLARLLISGVFRHLTLAVACKNTSVCDRNIKKSSFASVFVDSADLIPRPRQEKKPLQMVWWGTRVEESIPRSSFATHIVGAGGRAD